MLNLEDNWISSLHLPKLEGANRIHVSSVDDVKHESTRTADQDDFFLSVTFVSGFRSSFQSSLSFSVLWRAYCIGK